MSVERVVRTGSALVKTSGTRITVLEFSSVEESEMFEELIQDVVGHDRLMRLLRWWEMRQEYPVVPMDY